MDYQEKSLIIGKKLNQNCFRHYDSMIQINELIFEDLDGKIK